MFVTLVELSENVKPKIWNISQNHAQTLVVQINIHIFHKGLKVRIYHHDMQEKREDVRSTKQEKRELIDCIYCGAIPDEKTKRNHLTFPYIRHCF